MGCLEGAVERRMRSERRSLGDLHGGEGRRSEQLLGIEELAGAEEIADRDAEDLRDNAREMLACQAKLPCKLVSTRGCAALVTRPQVKIRATLEAVPRRMTAGPAAAAFERRTACLWLRGTPGRSGRCDSK